MSTEPPLITENQANILRALLIKKGWSEAYFAWYAKKPLAALTTGEGRKWITRLTKETKGKAKPAALLEPPEPIPPTIKPRRKVESPGPEATAVPPLPAVSEVAAAIMDQLGLAGVPTRQGITQMLNRVGVQIGITAAALTLEAKKDSQSRLTPFEQWVAYCHQLDS